jgi:hypothetical protein
MTFSITAHYDRYAGCRYVECRDYLNIMLRVDMLSVIMLNVVMLSVVAPFKVYAHHCFKFNNTWNENRQKKSFLKSQDSHSLIPFWLSIRHSNLQLTDENFSFLQSKKFFYCNYFHSLERHKKASGLIRNGS